jgi:hypothetical protein
VPFGGFAPNAAQAAIITLAQRSRLKRGVPADAVAAGQSASRGTRRRDVSGGVVPLYQASATERGALFNPDYNIEELDFRAHTPSGGVFVDVGPMSAPSSGAGP